MPRKAKINLHAVDREFKRVKAKLNVARQTANASEKGQLQDLMRKLNAVHAQTTDICPKALSIFPPDAVASPQKRAAKKPSSS